MKMTKSCKPAAFAPCRLGRDRLALILARVFLWPN
jgi:hypothetical protein